MNIQQNTENTKEKIIRNAIDYLTVNGIISLDDNPDYIVDVSYLLLHCMAYEADK